MLAISTSAFPASYAPAVQSGMGWGKGADALEGFCPLTLAIAFYVDDQQRAL